MTFYVRNVMSFYLVMNYSCYEQDLFMAQKPIAELYKFCFVTEPYRGFLIG